jgi:hypothetical protein
MRERKEAQPPELPDRAEAKPTSTALESKASPAEPTPRSASELVAMPVKSFAPPKPAPSVAAKALLSDGHPLFPRLKALPLRPKIAPAPRQAGQQQKTDAPQTPAAPEPAVKAPQSKRAGAPSKMQVAQKPAPPNRASKPVQTSDTEKPAPVAQEKEPAQTVGTAKFNEASSQKQSEAAKPAIRPVNEEQIAKPIPVRSAPAAPPSSSVSSTKTNPAAALPTGSPSKTAPVPEAPKPKDLAAGASKAVPAAFADATPIPVPSVDTVPNFGAVVNTSMFGSMKVKLGIAALAVVVATGAYFGIAGKSGKPAAGAAKSSDGVGPSIMIGEGGWVEGWAGDPIGLHGGRQITIYRPSLKLTDYRFDFQGQIDTSSIGWIFRAADPQNYYAMKLQLVSPELPLTVVLYKYIVLKGRQVQVGRVPIDVPVKNDTVFSIRVDVRGPKFNTFVQGQAVDFWTDDQLRSGGVGFLNERSERGKIKSVSLSYLSGGTK